jgi:hypothetical protein
MSPEKGHYKPYLPFQNRNKYPNPLKFEAFSVGVMTRLEYFVQEALKTKLFEVPLIHYWKVFGTGRYPFI